MVWSCALSKLIQKWHSPKSESHKLKFLISGTHSLLISRTHSLRGSQEFYPRKFFNFWGQRARVENELVKLLLIFPKRSKRYQVYHVVRMKHSLVIIDWYVCFIIPSHWFCCFFLKKIKSFPKCQALQAQWKKLYPIRRLWYIEDSTLETPLWQLHFEDTTLRTCDFEDTPLWGHTTWGHTTLRTQLCGQMKL